MHHKTKSILLTGLFGLSTSALLQAAIIAHWTMDDAQADMFLVGGGPHGHPDDAENNYDGLYFSYSGPGGVAGDPQFNVYSVAGKVGTAADFGAPDGAAEGHNAHAVVHNTTVINPNGDTTSTVGAWFNLSSTAAGRKWILLDSAVYGLNVDGDNLQLAYHNGGWNYESSSVTLSLDTWYYGAFARNGSSGTLYVFDSSFNVLGSDSITISGTVTSNPAATTQIGGAGVAENFGGIIDEVKVNDAFLDQAGVIAMAIPEPSSLVLVSVALISVLGFARRRRN